MLRLELIVHDQQWPRITLTLTRQSQGGPVVQQEKIQYDLAQGKAEEMVGNHLRRLISELLNRHQPSLPVRGA
jgi:hypothetical protein